MFMELKRVIYIIIIFIFSFIFITLSTIHILNNESKFESLYYIADSTIDGKGVFAKNDIKKETDLGIITIHGLTNIKFYRRYVNDRFHDDHRGEVFKEHRDIGRFINHSDSPNTKIIMKKNKCKLIVTQNINKDDEIVVDYKPFRDKYMNGYMGDVKG